MKTRLKSLVAAALMVTTIAGTAEAKKKDKYIYEKMPELLLDFANTRYQAYFHYNMCTFKNLQEKNYQGRSYGKEPISMFDPKGLDTDQWAQVCKDARMEGGWLTTKHHGGFCLWDSKFTTYDVGSAKDKRDIVGEFVKSFRKAGLKVGLYYSILDYHHGVENGSTTVTELQFIKNQITELLTNYGPIDYLNFDGWSTWPTNPDFDDIQYGEILDLVKSLQPNCLIISHTYESNLSHAEVPFADAAGRNYPYHPDYMNPCAASDFLQGGWWWDDTKRGMKLNEMKSVNYVLGKLNSYNKHNAVYILNISPNPSGAIDEVAITRLKEVAAKWDRPADIETIGDDWGYSYNVNKNLAFAKPVVQSSTEKFIRDKRAYPRGEIAVDGVQAGSCDMEQTSLTKLEDQPWWRVDLGATQKVKKITIYNSTDKYKDQLKDFTVSLLDPAGNVVWESYQKDAPSPSVSIPVGKENGRFVMIQLKGRGQLAIAEVIVE